VKKSHILQEVALFNILAEHGGSRGVNFGKILQSKVCTTGTAGVSVMEGMKSKTVNSEKWQPLVSSSLTVAGGAMLQRTD
jgi:hypothetical protein